jgi:conjugal transfer pilus assembly protein TraK
METAVNRTLPLTGILLSLSGLAPLQAAQDPGIELPPVSRAVLVAARSGEVSAAALRRVSATGPEGKGDSSALELGPKTIAVAPGTTAIVEVAIDHLNRIVTPFASPRVRTVSDATTQVEGNAVYVATASEDPVSLYITDANDAESALSLTLAPRRVPPREVRLSLIGGAMPLPVRRPGVSGRGELDQPYVEAVARVFRDLAQNKVPSGYGLRKASRGEHVTCGQYGIKVTRGQVLEGHRLWLITARVKNTGKRHLELEERTCLTGLGDGIAAVAAWPRVLLAPGESAELYLAARPRDPERERRDRPSLIDPGNAK